MGVKHSKQSVDISSTPQKAGVPVEAVNGKKVEENGEKVETITKVCWDLFTSLGKVTRYLFIWG